MSRLSQPMIAPDESRHHYALLMTNRDLSLSAQWLLQAAENAPRYANSPSIALAIDVSHRLRPLMDDIQARADQIIAARNTLAHIGEISSVVSILQRQEDTLARIAGPDGVASPV